VEGCFLGGRPPWAQAAGSLREQYRIHAGLGVPQLSLPKNNLPLNRKTELASKASKERTPITKILPTPLPFLGDDVCRFDLVHTLGQLLEAVTLIKQSFFLMMGSSKVEISWGCVSFPPNEP